ncbi:MAG TPA: Rieske (2Fe-2S) protein [Ktedonobacterales bacterium]|nr:Rieske (2Fe-2S) protein [Ktedonobacterales bacterium]
MDQERRQHRTTGGPAGADEVADYLEFEEHLKALQANKRPRRPRRMSPDAAGAYQMAALFRAGSPDAAAPDPEFAARLRAQLEREVAKGAGATHAARIPQVSRRGLLTGGLSAAAAAAGLAAGLNMRAPATPPAAVREPALVEQGVWLPVAAVDSVPLGGVRRFVTDSLVGYLRHTSAGFEALSAACTHMGCLTAWNESARTFDCPCHGGRFLETGRPSPASSIAYRPLPAIATRVQDGQVLIYAPTPGASPTAPSDLTPYTGRGAMDPTN